MRITGHYETLGSIQHFIPEPLPPHTPPFSLDTPMAALYGEAMMHLAKVNEMTRRLPDAQRFIRAYVIKEALLSSAIEGIHTTLLDVFTQPLLETKPSQNTKLVMNYTKALYIALSLLKKDGLPIASRVILAAHEALMQLEHSEGADPGNFRKQSVRVGNLVPPPAPRIPELMAALEQFINMDTTLPPLIKAGLAHVQFETIHPFLDGNGRIGRLLIVLMLVENGLLSEPILYPSYYFKKHHMQYYQQLDRVRTHGDFEGWITYYLTAIKESSIDAYQRAKDIETLEEKLTQLIIKRNKTEKVAALRLRALTTLFSFPVITINELSLQLGIAYNTAHQIISDFIDDEILMEEAPQKRGKFYRFADYLDILQREYAQ